MIFAFIGVWLLLAINIILSPLRLLPDVSLPSQITASFATAGSWLGLLHQIIPLTLIAVGAIITAHLIIEGAIFLFKTIKFGYNKIPGVN